MRVEGLGFRVQGSGFRVQGSGFRVQGPGCKLENNYFTEMCSGSEAGSYLRFIVFVYYSTLGLRVIKKKRGCKHLGGLDGIAFGAHQSELMAPRTDRTTRIPTGVASPVTTNHAARGSMLVNLRNGGNLQVADLPLARVGKGANGSKNRPHDAYPVRCRVLAYYEPCSERVCICQLKKYR